MIGQSWLLDLIRFEILFEASLRTKYWIYCCTCAWVTVYGTLLGNGGNKTCACSWSMCIYLLTPPNLTIVVSEVWCEPGWVWQLSTNFCLFNYPLLGGHLLRWTHPSVLKPCPTMSYQELYTVIEKFDHSPIWWGQNLGGRPDFRHKWLLLFCPRFTTCLPFCLAYADYTAHPQPTSLLD